MGWLVVLDRHGGLVLIKAKTFVVIACKIVCQNHPGCCVRITVVIVVEKSI